MRFLSFAAIAALSATVLAQGLNDIPKCAQTCFASSVGSCGATDFACICGNTAVIDKVSCCILATCPPAEIAATTQLAVQLCKLQNIQVNTAPSCPSGSATSSASIMSSDSATPSGSATSTGSATSFVGNGTASASSGSNTATASFAVSTGAASFQSTGGQFGLGAIVAGMFVGL